ncbi:MAG: hypothetical protein CBD29_08545 [Synechococcus sp. TMED169]|jgi:hypothetical protein|nr:MAG: hypothetical protein CBD29_08545 [Synechococcus sp. TMED169]|tara:strand:- start:106 stop:477 length:372 start_codon:yes stop_codon:yes gene_type:complete
MLPTSLCRGSSTSQQRKEQQLVIRLCKDIARAQFVFANPKRSQRLWDEAAALEIEPDRLLHLLYGGVDLDNPADLMAADDLYVGQRHGYRRGPWVSKIFSVRRGKTAFPAQARSGSSGQLCLG